MIFLNAAVGAASGALTDVGINEHFMKELSATLSPDSSTLFVRADEKSNAGQGRLLEELKGTGSKILKRSLSHEDEAKTTSGLECGKIVKPFLQLN